ncbi:CoA-binding domain-containing protein 5 [Seminavis robusta]|uniref:CoA-binding domain-containing protein 5 n=1 Tax=Seminavis robusta TaxID=568900 RepID=A0A9N8DWB3_9STRA|nr:CoA-binding domain-containing protein 5 [Seminavis robusta]|eukprot:Sro322_g117140.1 CoA-binding domain-containing protein 5 (141) ;mRNA; r:69026-69448
MCIPVCLATIPTFSLQNVSSHCTLPHEIKAGLPKPETPDPQNRLNSSSMTANLQESFDKAVELASSPEGGKWPMSNEQKLTMYGCYKQINVGDCTGSRPSMFNPVAQKKFDAWNAIKGTSKDEAMMKYVAIVETFAPDEL